LKKKVYNSLKRYIDTDFILEKPKEIKFGHYSTPVAFSLAKILRKSPMIIAENLSQELKDEEIFCNIEAVKGYINLKLSDTFLDNEATNALKNENDFAKDTKDEKILLEYVSANPTGPLHIGHARGAVFGDTLYRIAKHLGYKIDTEYYVNDAGNQIYLLGLSVYLSGKDQFLDEDVKWPDEYYRGEYINDLAKEAYEHFGKSLFEDEKNIEKLSSWAKDKMLELIKSNLKECGIEFDNFVSEKELYKKWDKVFDKLKANDALYEKDGKWWLKSTLYGDEKDRVVVREDGRATYLAGDIIYHDDKFERGYDRYINIWGADHHGYIARVKAAVKFLGYDENRLEVILSQMVSLLKGGEPYKMSKRAGNFILMSDIVKEIGSDALRFVFLTKKSDTHLEFDIDTLKANDSSNPIYYINYAHARVNQLFEKSGKKVEDIIDVELKDLNESGKNLLFYSLLLPEVLEDALSQRALQKLSEYLKNLASFLHKFYNEQKVIGSKDEDKLLKIFAIAALSIRTGLKLMGIKAKEKM
jgi:arginyl-tRNA synthetase